MSEGSGSRQWRDRVQSRTQGEVKTHVQNMLRDRKQDVNAPAPTLNFRQFVEMKRALAGPDGKSRSKSGSSEGKQHKGQNQGRPFLRQTQPQTPHKTAANENKKPVAQMSGRQTRLAKGFEAAKNHFKKVTEKVKGTIEKVKEKRANQLPKNNAQQISNHSAKQRIADAGAQAKQRTKVQQKPPTPPGPKRGR